MIDLNEYTEQLNEIINSGKIFGIKFYIIDDEIEQKVEASIRLLLKKYGKSDYYGVLYTCIKELMMNAAKANLKRILFEINHLDIDNEDTYIQSMMKFKDMMTEKQTMSYLNILKEKDYWIHIRFHYDDTGCCIEVVNNAHMTALEDRRLREKLRKAMQYDDIVQYYVEQGDELEGAGMGIALIVMLLKGIDINTSYFRIGNTSDYHTFARIEVPFKTEFISKRNIQIN